MDEALWLLLLGGDDWAWDRDSAVGVGVCPLVWPPPLLDTPFDEDRLEIEEAGDNCTVEECAAAAE